MIKTWKEIMSRYDAIKDHKPRATKKLKELGEILASAYKKSPSKADEMWQYIIDLNISDNVEFARFYVVQVFTKLVYELTPFTATEFLVMNPERLRLLLLHGFEGSNYENCVYYTLGYYIILEDIEGIRSVIAFMDERQNSKNRPRSSKESMISDTVFSLKFEKAARDRRHRDPADLQRYFYVKKSSVLKFIEFYTEEYSDSKLAFLFAVYKLIITETSIEDSKMAETYADRLIEYKSHLFFSFLYLERDVLGGLIEEYLESYCEKSNQPPPVRMGEKTSGFKRQKTEWYRTIVLDSKRLMCALFSNHSGYFCDFMEEYLNDQIENDQWENFVYYFTQLIDSADGYRFDDCVNYLDNCVNYYVLGEWDDKPSAGTRRFAVATISIAGLFGVELPEPEYRSRLTEKSYKSFIGALGQISDRMNAETRKIYVDKVKQKCELEIEQRRVVFKSS